MLTKCIVIKGLVKCKFFNADGEQIIAGIYREICTEGHVEVWNIDAAVKSCTK